MSVAYIFIYLFDKKNRYNEVENLKKGFYFFLI